MATKKITVEVEVPEGVDERHFRMEVERQLARIALLITLETLQKRIPSPREVEDLAREIKKRAYRGHE
ncbi:MAG: hypothetical protein GSR85_04425 [Desulfurococcales archaeon]|nr:hypothetical protein [Desulfurococcales archaeon]